MRRTLIKMQVRELRGKVSDFVDNLEEEDSSELKKKIVKFIVELS